MALNGVISDKSGMAAAKPCGQIGFLFINGNVIRIPAFYRKTIFFQVADPATAAASERGLINSYGGQSLCRKGA